MSSDVKVKKETKNRIRVEFDRTPLLERLKAKFVNGAFLVNIIWFIFRLLLLIGVSYVILFPFYTKIAGSFMSPSDFVDVTVRLIPKYPTLDQYKAIINDNGYFMALFNTFLLAGSCAVLQTFVCCLISYGLAKFKFKGNAIVFLLVVFTMVVPHSTLQYALFMKFRYFDFYGILKLLTGTQLNLLNSYWPLIILSITGLGFKNGLYVFLLRQFFKGIPDELEESAYLDGSGTFRTFVQIILPMSVPMLITVFMFAFSWQWTDNFYTNLFFIAGAGPKLMPNIVKVPKSLSTAIAGESMYVSAIKNTAGLLIIIPLLIIYLFAQRYIMEGIERSGITG
ncbi:MAG: carbohydrate ABC transporter permease [Clostridia bacterium]|nr:carbohydrate ABC transporter permease [Clostridia bacterium]